MSKRYLCVESFAVPMCDDDGFTIENQMSVVESGTVWEITNNDVIGGEIHLEEIGRPWHWLEITKEHFEMYFRDTWEDVKKDEQWYRLYNLYQVTRYALHEAENPEGTGVDSYPPWNAGGVDEPMPKCEFQKEDKT